MIAKMRKLTILVSKTSVDSALHDLRELGVVHVSHLRKPHADYIDTLRRRLSRLDKVLDIVGKSEGQKKLSREELVSASKEIVGLAQEKNKLKDRLAELNQKTAWFEQWGDVSKKDLEKLADKNIFIKLYLCGEKEFKKLNKDKLVYIIGRKGSNLRLIHISTSKDQELKFQRVEIPQESLSSLNKEINYIQQSRKEIEEKISSFSVYRNCFTGYKKKLLNKLEFIKVKFGMEGSEALAWLQGFCPLDSVKKVKKTAQKNGWAIAVEKPNNPREVPTLIRNPKWIEIIKPVFNFMGTLPGYKEYDISFWFLLFFSLFFAMLVGDAGYGIIFLIATYLARRKFKQAPAAPFFLIYTLSFVTIIWGALTGNWFGVEAIARLPFFNFLVLDQINSFAKMNQNFMIYFCFVIGVVHLSIAHLIKAFRYLNSLKALAEVGWVCILWTAFFVASQLLVGKPFPNFTLGLGVSGITAVILFSNFQKNVLKGALSTLGTLPLDVISSFTDIVSYLRLFAVGYATLAVATAFNTMATSTGLGGFLGGVAAAIILFLGHSLNILLCLMSVVVHGIRLNLLEFSGQLGMEWSGKEYQPFK
jgi:V/A-type H+-transporting ATPase subunit I